MSTLVNLDLCTCTFIEKVSGENDLYSLLLGGGVGATAPTIYYISRISYWPNKLKYVNCESHNCGASFVTRWWGSRWWIFLWTHFFWLTIWVILIRSLTMRIYILQWSRIWCIVTTCVYVSRFIVILTQLKLWAVIIQIQNRDWVLVGYILLTVQCSDPWVSEDLHSGPLVLKWSFGFKGALQCSFGFNRALQCSFGFNRALQWSFGLSSA